MGAPDACQLGMLQRQDLAAHPTVQRVLEAPQLFQLMEDLMQVSSMPCFSAAALYVYSKLCTSGYCPLPLHTPICAAQRMNLTDMHELKAGCKVKVGVGRGRPWIDQWHKVCMLPSGGRCDHHWLQMAASCCQGRVHGVTHGQGVPRQRLI